MGILQTYHLCAVDGGGSGCRAAVATPDGTVLSTVSGGPANYTSNPSETLENTVAAVTQAASEAGAAPERMIAHVGLAGIMGADDSAALAARLPFARVAVTDDRPTSAAGALGNRDGAVLAIGTGSFAAFRRGDAMRFLGGWGLNLGDQASGARLGRDLLEHVLLAGDGLAEESALTGETRTRLGGPAKIVAFATTARPADYAAFAPGIADAADAGDPVARHLMERGAAYLNAALDSAKLTENEVVCLTGGLGPRYAPYLAPGHRALLAPPAGTALDGALSLAYRLAQDTEARA